MTHEEKIEWGRQLIMGDGERTSEELSAIMAFIGDCYRIGDEAYNKC